MSRLEKLKALVETNPDDPFPRYGLAMEHRNLNQTQEAEAVFRELLERNPEYIPAFLHYGVVLVELDRTDEAREVFSKGLQVSSAKGDQHAYEELQAALEQLV